MSSRTSSFFDRSPDMLCVLDAENRALDTNCAWTRTLGWTHDDLKENSIDAKFHEHDRVRVNATIAEARVASEHKYVEAYFLHSDGEYRFVFCNFIFDRETQLIYMSMRDRTEYKNEREKMENTQRQLQTVFASMREGVVVFGANGDVVQHNETALRLLGISLDQLRGKASLDPSWTVTDEAGQPIHPGDMPGRKALRTGITEQRLLGTHHPDGRATWVFATVDPLFDQRSKSSLPIQSVVTFHDMTQERQSRIEIERKERQLARILNAVPAEIGYWDLELRNVHANRLYGKLLNMPPEEMKGRHIRDVLPPDSYERSLKYIQAALRGESNHFERSFKHAKGHMVELYVSYLPDFRNGILEGFFIVALDVTRIKNLEKDRREFEAKFVAASKMSSLGEMAAGIAHEINNPLAIINGKTTLLQQRIERGRYEELKFLEDLKSINNTVERIAKTVRGLLSFARHSDQEDTKVTNLQSIIDTTLDLCREKFRNRGVDLRLQLGSSIDVKCHSHQISQILMNLLNNANDAVSTHEHPWISVDVDGDEKKVRIRITDSGLGIPEDIADKLMNPFFTTKEIGKGTGLGLSISKGLAESHGGTLAYDRSHANTSFVLELPVAAIPNQTAVTPLKAG